MARITHYASLVIGTEEVFGTAELLSGSGYLFRAEGQRQARLISYKDTALMLYGRCDLANDQYIDDELHGGPARIACSRAQEVR